MKAIFSFIAVLFSAITVSAQTSNNTIYTCARGNVNYTKPQEKESVGEAAVKIIGAVLEAKSGSSTVTANHPEYANAIADAIAGGIGRSYRVRVIDSQFLPGEVEKIADALYFDGSIASITTTDRIKEVADKDGKKHDERQYSAHVNATINIKDAHTDVIVNTINISSSSWSESWYASTDKAMAYVMEKITNYVTQRINRAFPLYATIIEGNTVKKDKQKEVYIDLGTDFGIPTGLTFAVYQSSVVAGKETSKQIGSLRVKEVLGPEISRCKVTSGGAAIKRLLENDVILEITSQF